MEKKHSRVPSNGRKLQLANAKPARPTQLQKRQSSYHSAQPQSLKAGSNPKQLLGASKKGGTEIVNQDDDETGMASFLQFCATCERQIVTPGSSILYCSAACRKNDVSRNEPVQTVHSPSLASYAASYFEMPPADIVPQRSPTRPRPLSLALSDLSLSDYEDRASNHSNYYDHSADPNSRTRPRPRTHRGYTATESSGMPSLTHTPSSSIGTVASASSYSSRPLPPRHDPKTCHCPTRSADLVIPTYPNSATSSPDHASLNSSVSTLTAFKPSDAGDVEFSRQSRTSRHSEPGAGSLRKLFSHEAMQAPPNWY